MSATPIPIIAIVGRPNVGKSTLFNRFAGRRRALVDDLPGITRDRIVEEIEVGSRRVLLVDTAGLDPEPESGIETAIQSQVQTAIEQADAILLVVDGEAGLIPHEEDLARLLRRTDRPVAVAVNKIDTPRHAARVAEFHALGLDPIRGISAEHGAGAWDLLEELVAAIPEAEGLGEATGEGARQAPGAEGELRIALVGRPNVGKSSLLNRILGSERVVVSDVPGTTRDSVDIRIEREDGSYLFVDTAGLRRPGRRHRIAEKGSALMTVRALERADIALVVADAGDGFAEQDAHIVALVRDRGCATVLLLNKWDLVQAREDGFAERVDATVERGLRGLSDVPVLRISAKTGRGVERIFPRIRRLGVAFSLRVPTAELNRWLEDSVRRHEPAMAQRGSRRRPIKFFYATQTGSRPPTFILFCNQPESVQPSYRRFLENRLREQFDLEGVPIRIRLRARHDKRRR
jgi:GTP-binding protein